MGPQQWTVNNEVDTSYKKCVTVLCWGKGKLLEAKG